MSSKGTPSQETPQTSGATAPIMSMTTLIHAGIELIAIIGVAFWLNSKISAAQVHSSALEEKIKEYDAIFKRQGEIIANHENALRQIYSMLNNGNNAGNPPNNKKQQMSKKPVNKPKIPPKPVKQEDSEEENENDSDENLDELIKDEIEEMSCSVDGICEEVVSPSLKKKSTTSTTSTRTRTR